MTDKNKVVEIKAEEEEGEVYELLQGFTDKEGVTHKRFSVEEMTGEEEEAIAKNDVKSNGGKITRVLIERCMTNLGTLTKKTIGASKWREMIQELSVGDQDLILMKIRAVSMGEELEVGHTCPECKQELVTTLNLDELETIPYNGTKIIEFELPKGFKDSKGEIHKFGQIRHPNGLDREMLSTIVKSNTGIANTMLLTRCIIKFEGMPSYDQAIRKLSIRDRDYLVTLLKDNEFGVDLETEVVCTSCGTAFKGNLNSTNFI